MDINYENHTLKGYSPNKTCTVLYKTPSHRGCCHCVCVRAASHHLLAITGGSVVGPNHFTLELDGGFP